VSLHTPLFTQSKLFFEEPWDRTVWANKQLALGILALLLISFDTLDPSFLPLTIPSFFFSLSGWVS
jgi:hypothetical protein